jgi:hypothetical protein
MDIDAADAFKTGGGQILRLSDAEAARWVKALEPMIANWKKIW